MKNKFSKLGCFDILNNEPEQINADLNILQEAETIIWQCKSMCWNNKKMLEALDTLRNLFLENDRKIKELIRKDLELKRIKRNNKLINEKYNLLLEENDAYKTQLHILKNISDVNERIITVKEKTKTETTAILLLSDWHIEERVLPNTVNNFNEYNIEIAEKRWLNVFHNALKLIKHFSTETQIKNVVIALLGDFISWYIHDELQAVNEVNPILAVIKARDILYSWIKYFLDNSDYTLYIPCHVWNHWRASKERRPLQYNYSFEYIMYLSLMEKFLNNERVKYHISDSYFSYFNIYNYTIRFHHWDAIRWWGGIWWITAPILRTITRWNTALRADIDAFWHFHQSLNWKNFVVNWSLIWITPYSINFWYEQPSQTLFLINSKYWKTIFAPIFAE